jgi:hypothetical protein
MDPLCSSGHSDFSEGQRSVSHSHLFLSETSGSSRSQIFAPAFLFNEASASCPAEYIVTMSRRGAKSWRTVECKLTVDRWWMHHEVHRDSQDVTGRLEFKPRKRSLRETVRDFAARGNCFWTNGASKEREPPPRGSLDREEHRQHGGVVRSFSKTRKKLCCNRKVQDIIDVSHRKNLDPRVFALTYRQPDSSEGRTKIVYQACTPTECTEIVERLRFLLSLV